MGTIDHQDSMGERMALARNELGLSQAEVAEELGVSVQSVCSWECDRTTPKLDRLVALCSLYHISADWLLTGKTASDNVLEMLRGLNDRLFDENEMEAYIKGYLDSKNMQEALRALGFAKEQHAGQYRKTCTKEGKIPYIYHPLIMACHAKALFLDEEDIFSTIFLHDVLEDCSVTAEELPVNDRVKEAVILLTKPSDFKTSEKARTGYFDRITRNRIAVMVKILDRCNNVSTMGIFSDDHLARYVLETQQYICPMLSKAKKLYPEYTNQYFDLRYHLRSVILALGQHMRQTAA